MARCPTTRPIKRNESSVFKSTRKRTYRKKSLTKIFHKISREKQQQFIDRKLKKGSMPLEIYNSLKQRYQQNAYSLESVRYYRRKFLKKKLGIPTPPLGRPRKKHISEMIRTMRAQGNKFSIKKTAKVIKEPRSTVADHFRYLGGKLQKIKTIPHQLKKIEKKNRVERAKDILRVLKKKNNWPSIVTGDESWFYLSNDGQVEWIFPGENSSTKIRRSLDH